MDITMAEFQVLYDTLSGSMTICDRGQVFRWDSKNRQKVLNNLTEKMNHIKLIELEEKINGEE